MQKFKKISALFENGNNSGSFGSGAVVGGNTNIVVETPPNTNDNSKKADNTGKKQNTGGNTNPTPETTPQDNAKPDAAKVNPTLSLLQLPGAVIPTNAGIVTNEVFEEWPGAVHWFKPGKEKLDPNATVETGFKTAYLFDTSSGKNQVSVWIYADTFEKGQKHLYFGNYALPDATAGSATLGSKVTINGIDGQVEEFDLKTGAVLSKPLVFLMGSRKEVSATIMSFKNRQPSFSWYWFMRLHNLKTQDPELYKTINTSKINPGYTAKPETTVNLKSMSLVASTIREKAGSDVGDVQQYWPVVNKFYEVFAPNQAEVPFCSITTLDKTFKVRLKSGAEQEWADGYQYIADRLKKAQKSDIFSDSEALCFYHILVSMSRSAIDTLNKYATTAAIDLEGKTCEEYILSQVSGNWKDVYEKYIRPLQDSNGKLFPPEALTKGENSVDHAWLKAAETLWIANPEYLKKALAEIPDSFSKSENEPSTSSVVMPVSPIPIYYAPSDIRVKENINLIGKSKMGLNIYSFKYKGQPGYYQGVMAQDLIGTAFENAVSFQDGMYKVNYALLDVKFKAL